MRAQRGRHRAKAAVGRHAEAGIAIIAIGPQQIARPVPAGRIQRAAAFPADRQPRAPDLAAYGQRCIGAGQEAAGAGRVLAHQKGRLAGTLQPDALQGRQLRAGPLRDPEADGCVRRYPGRDPSRDQARAIAIALLQLQRAELGGAIAARGDGQGERHRPGFQRNRAAAIGERAGQAIDRRCTAQAMGQIGIIGPAIGIEHHRADSLARQPGIAHGAGQAARALIQRDHGAGPGDAGGTLRLKGAGNVQDAAPIYRIGAALARLARAAQQDLHDLRAAQIGEGLRQQRRSPADLRRGKGSAVEDGDEPLAVPLRDADRIIFIFAADRAAERGQHRCLRSAGAVAEAGDVAAIVHRRGDDHIAAARLQDGLRKGAGIVHVEIGIVLAELVAGRDDDDHAARHRAADGGCQRAADPACAAQRYVEHARAALLRHIHAGGDRTVAEAASRLIAFVRHQRAAARCVRAQRQDGGIEGDAVHIAVVLGRREHAGDRRAMAVLIAQRPAARDIARFRSDAPGKFMAAWIDAGVDHAHGHAAAGRAAAIDGDGVVKPRPVRAAEFGGVEIERTGRRRGRGRRRSRGRRHGYGHRRGRRRQLGGRTARTAAATGGQRREHGAHGQPARAAGPQRASAPPATVACALRHANSCSFTPRRATRKPVNYL